MIVWLPMLKSDLLKLASPLPLRAVGPANVVVGASHVPPSMKLTFPVGVPLPLVTVAVKVTDCPNADGFGEALTLVVVVVCTGVRLKFRVTV